MVRRVNQGETFHGTAAGQIPKVGDLQTRFGLTERQAQCAALLRMGNAPQGIAEVLGVSPSTLEAHLADLRRIFKHSNTESLRRSLCDLIPDAELDAFHCWPASINTPIWAPRANPRFAARLRTSMSAEQALDALYTELERFAALHLYYCFLPHSVQGFLRNDMLDVFIAPAGVKTAFRANNGLAGQPAAALLFEAPTSVPVVALDLEAKPEPLAVFNRACAKQGATHIAALGFPAGPGYVGMAITLKSADEELLQRVADESENIRGAAIATHAAMLTNGTLAARVRLTLRERDALSQLALGRRASEAARNLNVSERAFAKLVASARRKLKARTNAEAVGKAAMMNALVFL